ncbi:MAG TPA: sulfatase-like hydrolase/transferase [Methylotenera sp.]|nr:sulfatase-like hydrolase/transferase [Methylotenera sp.]
MQLSNTFRHLLRGLIRFSCYLLAFFLFALAIWIAANFGQPSLEQLLYHAQFGAQGLVDTDIALIKSFFIWCIAIPWLAAVLLVLFEYSIAMFLVYGSSHWITKPARRANLRFLKIFYWFISHRAPLYLMISAGAFFCFQFSINVFIHNQFGEDYFSEHYLNPALVKIKPNKPKNLVLIYVESLEDSYKQAPIFGKNLLASLDEVPGRSFSSYKSAPGSWWTIAGITATQCGLPLKTISLHDGNEQGHVIKQFLPNAVCLGDILHQAGYTNVYMGGDGLDFSGKGMFFKNHHYHEVYGRDELKTQLQNPELNYWGLYDDDLFKLAKQKLSALHASGKRFNLTITTIDTHGPDGHFSRYCKSIGAQKFEDIVTCTAEQVVDFVAFMQKKNYLKDTNVVIIRDHLAMENPVFAKLHQVKQRLIYNKFIGKQIPVKNREEILPFDMLPTILEFIGFDVPGGKLGLGVTGFSNQNLSTKLMNYEEMDANLLNQSDQYLELWRPKP